MSSPKAFSFVAGNEDLDVHELFDFNYPRAATNGLPRDGEDFHTAPRLASPFTGPLEDPRGQAFGWLSPSASPVDGNDTVNLEDYLATDDSDQGLLAVAEQPSSPPPGAAEVLSGPRQKIVAAPQPAESLPAALRLEVAQAEIAQLRAALAFERPQHKFLAAPEICQTASTPHKRKSTGGEVPPAKRRYEVSVGPVEAIWSSKVTEEERRAFCETFASPTTSVAPELHLDRSGQDSAAYISSPSPEFGVSSQDLESMRLFISSNADLINSAAQQVPNSISSHMAMTPYSVNTKVKRTPLKVVPKPITKDAHRALKKTKFTSKKTHRQSTAFTALVTSPLPNVSTGHRNIGDLLAANFYSLNEQEKRRVLLPMLHGLDPRELEESLSALPCFQAKGPKHHVRVAQAIRDSPPTLEADAELALRLTTGTPTPPTGTLYPPCPVAQASLLPKKTCVSAEASGGRGATLQREALEKAALLQAQGKKH